MNEALTRNLSLPELLRMGLPPDPGAAAKLVERAVDLEAEFEEACDLAYESGYAEGYDEGRHTRRPDVEMVAGDLGL